MADEVEVIAPSAGAEVETVAPPTTTAVEQPSGEALPETEALSTEAEQPEETEVDLDAVPESSGDFAAYKPLFKDHPELRTILGREQAFSSIAPNGSFSDLKGIVERIPTLEDAEVLASQAKSHRALGETFRSDPAAFVESLRENDQLAFSQLSERFPEILAQTDQRLYSQQAEFYSTRVLDNLFSIAQQQNNSEAQKTISEVAQMLGMRLGMPRNTVQPGNSEVERLKRELEDRKQKDELASATSFWDGASSEFMQNATTEIETMIRRSIPSVTDGQLQRMAGEVWEGVNTRLAQQPQTMSQIERFKQAVVSGGRRSVADHRAIVDFTTKRARMLIPSVWKEVSAEWTKQITTFSKEQIEKKNGIAAKTRDASTVAAPGTRAAAPPVNRGPVRDFDSVFEQIKNGTYRKPIAATR